MALAKKSSVQSLVLLMGLLERLIPALTETVSGVASFAVVDDVSVFVFDAMLGLFHGLSPYRFVGLVFG